MPEVAQNLLSGSLAAHQLSPGQSAYVVELDTEEATREDDHWKEDEVSTPGARALIAAAILRARGLE